VWLEEEGCGDRVTDWVSAGQQINLACGAAHFCQSASTLNSGNTELTLNFWQRVIKGRQLNVFHRIFQKYQGSGQDVNLCLFCVFWWNIMYLE
jgi:hypothetical protein